ncbi:MAG TPA: very short patch repair endonuclease [Candidatus Paceibacterota bacterium]
MVDIFTKEKRSLVMAAIRSKNTKPEIALRKLVSAALYPLGYRYRLHYRKIPGSPDIVFVQRRLAVFVDGDFWHGYKLRKGQSKLSKKYWLPKIQANMRRDIRNNRALRRMGWKVVRIWEHDLKKRPERVLGRILRCLTDNY